MFFVPAINVVGASGVASPFSFNVLAYGDGTSIQESGGTVTGWNDLSGNARHMEVSAGAPTYGATAYAGGPGVTMAAADGLRLVNTVAFAGNSACFGMNVRPSGGSSNPGYMAWIVNGGNSHNVPNILVYRPDGTNDAQTYSDGTLSSINDLTTTADHQLLANFSGTQSTTRSDGSSNSGSFTTDDFTGGGRFYIGKTVGHDSVAMILSKWCIPAQALDSTEQAELLTWLAS